MPRLALGLALAAIVGLLVLLIFRTPATISVVQPSIVTAPIQKTEDGILEIRTTSADQRVAYRSTETKIVCSEPTPDATLDVVTQGENSLKAAAGKLAGAGGEATSSALRQANTNQIFARSQAIQFFRDGMFHLCQARLNGSFSEPKAFGERFDLLMTRSYTLLEIELRAAARAAQERQEKNDSAPQRSPQGTGPKR
jgi:hypothetical protein